MPTMWLREVYKIKDHVHLPLVQVVIFCEDRQLSAYYVNFFQKIKYEKKQYSLFSELFFT